MLASIYLIVLLYITPSFANKEGLEECLDGGKVQSLFPTDEGYAQVRLSFNTYYSDRYPVCIAQPVSAAQVSTALACIRQANLELFARGGGHSYAGFSAAPNGTVLLDLSELKEIKVFATSTSPLVRVGAGQVLGAVYDALYPHELYLPGGVCPYVGVGGHTLGGGVGFISRTYGLLSDWLVAAEVVLANGTLVLASTDSNADLFWALRGGGGGSFGIVTEYTFKAIDDMPRIITRFNTTTILQQHPADLLYALQTHVPSLDQRLNFHINVTIGIGVSIDGHFLGPKSELEPLFAQPPLSQLEFNMMEGPYHQFWDAHGPDHAHAFTATSNWVYESRPLSQNEWHRVMAAANTHLSAGGPGTSIQFHAYGALSAINKVPANATAFAHRNGLWCLQALATFKLQDAGRVLSEFDIFHGKVQGIFDLGAYRCYPDPRLAAAEYMQAYYKDNAPRLQQIKTSVDPGNYFSYSQSVPPAACQYKHGSETWAC